MNIILAGTYVPVALAIGYLLGSRAMRSTLEWVRAERAPTRAERRRALLGPTAVFAVHAALWTIAAVGFSLVNLTFDARLVIPILLTVAIGGIVTSANAYILTERAVRPVIARALAEGSPGRLLLPGVTARTLLSWAIGTGAPILGLIAIAIYSISGSEVTRTQLAVTVMALGGVVLVFGLLLAVFAARATADPVRALRRAVGEVEAGNLDVEVPVYDATEVGRLQAGFNRMAAGLRERERIRDLFGRHVGEDVAHAALENDLELGGEVREVAILFVDIIGSTTLAATRPPQEVVEILNRFFAVVVEAVGEKGGWINKFEGDAALAIFGAPVPVDDPAGAALCAARDLAGRLVADVPDCEAGIGIAAGSVVAGNIGAEHRYEYTVIGDPVNEAARLTELAKGIGGRLVASERALSAAGEEERAKWSLGERVTLRGRTQETRLAVPREPAPARADPVT